MHESPKFINFPTQRTPDMCRKVYSEMTSILDINGGHWMTLMIPLSSKLQSDKSDLKFSFSIPKNLGKNTPILKPQTLN